VLNNILLTRFLQSFTLCYIILWKILIVVIIHEYGREDPNHQKGVIRILENFGTDLYLRDLTCYYTFDLARGTRTACIKFYAQEFHAPHAAPDCNTSTFNSNGGNGVE